MFVDPLRPPRLSLARDKALNKFAKAQAFGQGGTRGERRSVVSKRLLYCVNVNRTSLDHLPLGKNADVDQMSNNASIARDRRDVWFPGA